jgi:hypothetical protein
MSGQLAQRNQFPFFIRGKFGDKVAFIIKQSGRKRRREFDKVFFVYGVHGQRQR